jgi:tRNA-2-methylthio-N6-dimethylallyladenosine synthase
MKRYLVQTFGCQMNVHDSRRIEEVLEDHGYAATEEAALADLIVLNTCSVREKAEQKLRSAVGAYRALKQQRPELVIAVAGCVAQQEGEKLLRRVPHLDVVIGPDNIPELPALVEQLRDGAPPLSRTVFDVDAPQFLMARPRSAAREVTSFVTVMKGCDERCTYCIVPYTRGPERYRPADEIVAEVQQLVAGGVREAPGLLRLRYTSPHPRHLTPQLIAAHAELAPLCRHVHLPVQSGSDRMLKRMLRRYSADEYRARVRELARAVPGVTLSSDVIVGFPGESEQDFEATLALVGDVGFVSLFGFKYSPRPFTPALRLEDDVPEEVKDERLQRLFALAGELQQAHLQRLVGSTQQVLIESRDAARVQRFSGRSERNELVHVDAPEGVDPRGSLVEAQILEAFKHSLHGVMQGATPRPELVPTRKTRIALPLASA